MYTLCDSERKKFELIFETINRSAILSSADRNGNIIFVNEQFCEISGYSKEELIGKNHNILNSGFHPKAFFQGMWKTLAEGKVWRQDICNRGKNGEFFWVDSIIMPVMGGNREVEYVSVKFDISERKRIEMSRLHSSKMLSLSEMAGGVAHEINNPLAIIASKAILVKRQIEQGVFDSDKVKDSLNKIESTVERIAKIVRSLRLFSRDADIDEMENVKLSSIIETTFEMCHERFKNHSITLEINCNQEIWLECRPAQISQVLVSLLSNAHDAVLNLDEKWVSLHVEWNDHRVQINVIDSGLGVQQEVVEKMMIPFFTTKEVGKGTGLGLSVSKGMVEDHAGKLYYKASSKNTHFVLELPLSQLKSNCSSGKVA